MRANVQKAHYEKMHEEYERHYYDATSLEYRRKFILRYAVSGLDIANKRVADIACGSGWNTVLLKEKFPSSSFHGFDISQTAIDAYTNNTGFDATACDLTTYSHDGRPFDFAIVIGGLHHMVNNLPNAASTIASMLKPGGVLIAYEPNADFFLNNIRRAWYSEDRLFEQETERALSLMELQNGFGKHMELVDCRYLGGPGYFFILNSLVLRVPLALKKPIAPSLSMIESGYNQLPWRGAFPAFLSRWQKVG